MNHSLSKLFYENGSELFCEGDIELTEDSRFTHSERYVIQVPIKKGSKTLKQETSERIIECGSFLHPSREKLLSYANSQIKSSLEMNVLEILRQKVSSSVFPNSKCTNLSLSSRNIVD